MEEETIIFRRRSGGKTAELINLIADGMTKRDFLGVVLCISEAEVDRIQELIVNACPLEPRVNIRSPIAQVEYPRFARTFILSVGRNLDRHLCGFHTEGASLFIDNYDCMLSKINDFFNKYPKKYWKEVIITMDSKYYWRTYNPILRGTQLSFNAIHWGF